MDANYSSPDNVLVVTFDGVPENDKNAYQALTDLKQLDSQGQIQIAGAAVVTRDDVGLRRGAKSEVGNDTLYRFREWRRDRRAPSGSSADRSACCSAAPTGSALRIALRPG